MTNSGPCVSIPSIDDTVELDPQLDRLCTNCGLTWGAHRGDPRNEQCPGHQFRMDFEDGPGTVFKDSGALALVQPGTPARRVS